MWATQRRCSRQRFRPNTRVRIGLLSDTHGELDDSIFTYFSECDEVWHAGDVGDVDVLTRLRQFKLTRAVYGNVDGAGIRTELAHDLVWDCEGVRVYMTHIGGYPGNYDPRARKEIQLARPGLFICGHSHILKVMRDIDLDLVHMNPGACGYHGWHKVRTVLRFTVYGAKITGVEAIELGPRSKTHTPGGNSSTRMLRK